jgi:hypothetical protein
MPDLAAVFGVWAVPGAAVSEINAKAITAAELVCEMNRFRIFPPDVYYSSSGSFGSVSVCQTEIVPGLPYASVAPATK